MDYPEYIKVNNKEYKINTDFRIAIKCNEIAQNDKIRDYERALAIIYILFGDEAIEDAKQNPDLYEKFLKAAIKYLSCGKEPEKNQEKPDMDYIEDEGFIKSSFQYDYKYDPYEMDHVHWYKYFNDLNNLSNSEFGNCCVLNRVRNLRNMNLSEIKDIKERERIRKAQERFALKKYRREFNLTEQQEKSMEELNKLIGL